MGDTYVVNGALMTCTFGLAPTSLIVLPARTKQLNHMPRANIMDFAPMVNIMPFGMCNTLSNPVVAAATAAKLGVFTPAACIPAVTAPWMPGNPQCMVQGMPALTRNSQCICMWGGVIRFTTDGQIPGPPPFIAPKINSPLGMPMPGRPLSNEELSNMSEEEQEEYQKEMIAAQRAGSSEILAAEELDEMAKRYEEKGDIENMKKCQQASNDYKLMAAKKQADAMRNVNNKYRGVEDPYVKPDLSKEELEKIRNESLNKQTEKREEFIEANNEYLAKKKETEDLGKEVEAKNQNIQNKKNEYEKAKATNERLIKEQETAEHNVEYYKSMEKLAIADGDPNRIANCQMKREEAERYAEGMKITREKSEAERSQAFQNYVDSQAEHSKAKEAWKQSKKEENELLEKKEAKREEYHEQGNRYVAASQALRGQEGMEKHEAAKAEYDVANEANKEKRRNLSDKKAEEKQLVDEYNKYADKGDEQQSQGNTEEAKDYYKQAGEKWAESRQKHDEVKKAQEEKDQALSNLHEAYENSYSDDAKLAAYTARVEYEIGQNNLKNK